MFYRLLADVVLAAHAAFIAFALLGGLLVLWRRWWLWLHLPTALWASLISFSGWICPLTPLENRLRRAGNAAGYEGSFIEHYLAPLIYPQGLTPDLQYLLGAIAIGCNLAVYGFVVWSLRRPR